MNAIKLLIVLMFFTGCGEVTCREPYEHRTPIYVDISESGIEPDYFIQGWEIIKALGYNFQIADTEKPTAWVVVLNDPTCTLVGSTSGNTISLLWNAGPDVIAHEFLHLVGVHAHIDENKYPGCHLMNSSICLGGEMTEQDYELYANRETGCARGAIQ